MGSNEANMPAVRKASPEDASAVHELVQRTIRASYPAHYGPAVVAGFASLHGIAAIESDIRAGKVIVLGPPGTICATGTLDGNHVTRVFVSPEHQGAGYGTRIMDAIEREAARRGHGTAVLDTSVPAKAFYLHRGYSVTGVEHWEIGASGRHSSATLAYETMEKRLS